MEPVSIIVPAFNEEKAIGTVLAALKALPLNAEIVVVDDGSSDNTANIAREAGVVVVQHPTNTGYGRSLKDGILAAKHDVIVITDADGTYPIDRIPDLVSELERGFDMVVGARQGLSYRGLWLKMPARILFKFLVEFTTGQYIPDVNSGLRAFRKATAMKYFGEICSGFSFTTTITLIYLHAGHLVHYMPIEYHKRIGRSKVRMLRDSLRTMQYITECIVRYIPIKTFLLLSFGALLWGLLWSVLYGWDALFDAGLIAALLFGLGLVAESLRRPSQR